MLRGVLAAMLRVVAGNLTWRLYKLSGHLSEYVVHRMQMLVHWCLISFPRYDRCCSCMLFLWGCNANSICFSLQVGIGDPRSVVFHLPGNSVHIHVCRASNGNFVSEMNIGLDTVTSEELLITLIRNLKKYLMDDSVEIIDLSSRTLRVSTGHLFCTCSSGYHY